MEYIWNPGFEPRSTLSRSFSKEGLRERVGVCRGVSAGVTVAELGNARPSGWVMKRTIPSAVRRAITLKEECLSVMLQ